MGTHGLVQFSKSETGPVEEYFYKHYDGYPTNLGKFLKEFFNGNKEWVEGVNYDPEYTCSTAMQMVTEELENGKGYTDLYYAPKQENKIEFGWYYRLWIQDSEFYIQVTNAYYKKEVYKGKITNFEPKEEEEYFPNG